VGSIIVEPDVRVHSLDGSTARPKVVTLLILTVLWLFHVGLA